MFYAPFPDASPWDDALRYRLKAFHRRTVDAATDVVRLAYAMVDGTAPVHIGVLLQAYIDGVGSWDDSTRYRLRQVTDEVAQKNGSLAASASLFEHTWSVKPSAVEQYCPDLSSQLLLARPNEGLDAFQALDPCPNEIVDLRLPASIGGMIRRAWRGPLRIYATADAIAYIHPFQYQIISKDRSAFWISGSPRSLSRCSIPDVPLRHIDKNIIIIQDRFVFSNLCHFMFDGVTRILHYVEQFGTSKDDLFVLGSIPGDYQALVCAALAEHAGISRESLFFPDGAYLLTTSRRCFWFSDQVEGHSHPAQMAHPKSVSALAALCAKIPATRSDARRIYISRGDASRRRVANEDELVERLEERGFVSVQLGRHSAMEQIGLFREADIVVGPHGMGLTHIIAAKNVGKVIELFHPNAGTDAYALVARAADAEYDFVIGTDVPGTPHDFAIDVQRVLDLLGPEGGAMRQPMWDKAANLIPASRTFHGFVPVGASRLEAFHHPMIWGQEARLHRIRDDATEVGRWPHMLISAKRTYTLSCWIWIPHEFTGVDVSIQIGEWPVEARQAADPDQRDQWQRVWYTALAPLKDRCWAEIHVVGPPGSWVASTCWQFEVGDLPTSYVATS